MALQSKSISATGSKNHHKFTLTVTENSTSIANNNSSLSWSLVLSPVIKEYDWINNSGDVRYSVVINGTTYSGTITKYDGVSTVTVKSGTLSASHNTDGTKSISFSFSIKDSTGWSFTPGNASASGAMALTNIPRQATITVAPDFTDEENPTITYTNPAGSAVDSLALCITLDGSTTNALAYRSVGKTATTYTYTLSDADRDFLRNATPNSNTLKVGFYLRTIIGGVEYYSKVWKNMTVVNAGPYFDLDFEETDPTVLALSPGAYIGNVSDVKVTSGAKARKGATIKSQTITCGSVTINSGSGTFTNVTSGFFKFNVVDSRGNTGTITRMWPYIPYVNLTCSISKGKPDTDGNFTLTASGACYYGEIANYPGGTNTLNVYYRYKVNGGSYGAWTAMPITKGDESYTATVKFTGLDYRTTYTFQCKAVDRIATVTTEERAIVAMPVFDWSGEDFNFNVPVKFDDMTMTDFVIEQGEVDTWTYRKWHSGLAECWYRKQFTADVNTAAGALYTSGPLEVTDVTFPFTFYMMPSVTASLTCAGNGGFLSPANTTQLTPAKTGTYEILGLREVTGATYRICYHVVGRWK